jgi:hypothetical protein
MVSQSSVATGHPTLFGTLAQPSLDIFRLCLWRPAGSPTSGNQSSNRPLCAARSRAPKLRWIFTYEESQAEGVDLAPASLAEGEKTEGKHVNEPRGVQRSPRATASNTPQLPSRTLPPTAQMRYGRKKNPSSGRSPSPATHAMTRTVHPSSHGAGEEKRPAPATPTHTQRRQTRSPPAGAEARRKARAPSSPRPAPRQPVPVGRCPPRQPSPKPRPAPRKGRKGTNRSDPQRTREPPSSCLPAWPAIRTFPETPLRPLPAVPFPPPPPIYSSPSHSHHPSLPLAIFFLFLPNLHPPDRSGAPNQHQYKHRDHHLHTWRRRSRGSSSRRRRRRQQRWGSRTTCR